MSGADGAIHLRKPKRRVSFNSGDFEKEKLERVEMEAMEPRNSKTEGVSEACAGRMIEDFTCQIITGGVS